MTLSLAEKRRIRLHERHMARSDNLELSAFFGESVRGALDYAEAR